MGAAALPVLGPVWPDGFGGPNGSERWGRSELRPFGSESRRFPRVVLASFRAMARSDVLLGGTRGFDSGGESTRFGVHALGDESSGECVFRKDTPPRWREDPERLRGP